jgi:hypothetical protein
MMQLSFAPSSFFAPSREPLTSSPISALVSISRHFFTRSRKEESEGAKGLLFVAAEVTCG